MLNKLSGIINIMRFRVKILLILFFFIFFFTPQEISATSGCCSWHSGVCGCSGGRQLCCDGTLSPSCTCYSPPPPPRPTPVVFPENINATWNWSPNENKTFSLSVTLNDPNPSQYSAVLSKCRGCDPGPLTDFYSNNFYYDDVKPGTWYLNVKKERGGYWTNTVYWTINVPEWYPPSPTSVPIPTISLVNKVDTSTQSDDVTTVFGVFLFLAIGALGIYLSYKCVLWFFQYAKNHDWVYPTLFWIVVIGLLMYFALSVKPNQPSSSNKSKYTCNCSKTCPNMTCAEAYYQLNECGCSARDGDDDGVPCEEQCR